MHLLSFRGYRAVMLLVLSAGCVAPIRAQTITTPPQSQTAAAGAAITFTVVATGTALTYEWQRNGTPLPGATASTLPVANIQPQNAGIYTVVVRSGATSAQASAILGFTSTAKVTGAGTEVGANIVHPATGFTYDQILLQGAAAAVTADPGQILRISYIDLNDDIVQVEFSGAGTLTLLLDSSSGPAAPTKYNQANVLYMRGHAGIVIAGANETTNVSAFSVGTLVNGNPALYRSDVTYDGHADIAYVAITGGNGKFGGLRSANASYFATKGLTGVYAPGIQFSGPVFVGDIDAFDAATPVLIVGSAADVRITGGNLLQTNSQPVQVGGLTQLQFVDGSTSHGTLLPLQANKGVLQQNGVDVTAQLAPKPNASLYLAQLRPDPAASNSTGSGFATIRINADGTATVNITFSNLSSPQTSSHLQLGTATNFVLNLPIGQVSGRVWLFTPTATSTTNDLINALNSGNIYVGLDTAKYPAGELRGNFVSAAGSQSLIPPATPPSVSLANLSAADAARFLTQVTFGPKKSEIDALTGGSVSAWIDTQMALPFTSHRAATTNDQFLFGGSSSITNWNATNSENRQAAWYKVILTAPDQLRQRVAFALSQIFVISELGLDGDNRMEPLANYVDLLGNGAFGNFRTLLENVTLSPIMGEYLSSLRNAKANPATGTTPDENYAREVMQLFTIGLAQLQPDGTLKLDSSGLPIATYDQATVTEMAKVFTGWGYPSANLNNFRTAPQNFISPMQLFPAFHEDAAKDLSPVGPVVSANQGGTKDLQIALDALFNHANTGPFISRQLIQRLVTSNPSPGYVYRVAQKFANNGSGVRGDLGAVVRAILTDYEARSASVAGNLGYGKLKEPLLRVTNLLRSFGANSRIGRYAGFRYSVNGVAMTIGTPNPGVQSAVIQERVGQNTMFLQNNIAEAPQYSPSVFNFFLPDYVVPGTLASAGLVAPEFQITDDNFAISVANTLRNFLLLNNSANTIAGDAALVLDLSYEQTLVANPSALLDHLGLVLTGGVLPASVKTRVTTALTALPASATSLDRAQSAILMLVTSPTAAIQK